jgi:hypothetical protein
MKNFFQKVRIQKLRYPPGEMRFQTFLEKQLACLIAGVIRAVRDAQIAALQNMEEHCIVS